MLCRCDGDAVTGCVGGGRQPTLVFAAQELCVFDVVFGHPPVVRLSE